MRYTFERAHFYTNAFILHVFELIRVGFFRIERFSSWFSIIMVVKSYLEESEDILLPRIFLDKVE